MDLEFKVHHNCTIRHDRKHRDERSVVVHPHELTILAQGIMIMNRSLEDPPPQQIQLPATTTMRVSAKGDMMPFSHGRLDELGARTNQKDEKRDFLHCGKRPRKGQRTETVVHLGSPTEVKDLYLPSWVRLSGVVTQVGHLPSFSDWLMDDNFVKRLPQCGHCILRPLDKVDFQIPFSCPDPACYTNRALLDDTKNFMHTMMTRTLFLHGTLHNQEIISYAHLSNESVQQLAGLKYDTTTFPFQPGQVYKVTLVAHDSTPFFEWKVKNIENVTNVETFEDLPEEFQDFAYGQLSPVFPSSPSTLFDNYVDDSDLQQFLYDLHDGKMNASFEDT